MKKWIILAVIAAVLLLTVFVVIPNLRYPLLERKSVTRVKRLNELSQIIFVFEAYAEDNQKYPDSLSDLVKNELLEAPFIENFSEIHNPIRIIYARKPFEAIRAGESLSLDGDESEKDIPESRLIWVVGEEPDTIPETEFQKLYGNNLNSSN